MAKKKAKTKKKSYGFGESQIPTRSAKDFIVAFGKKENDERELFLTANVEKLDESFLDALPLVFENLTKGQSIDYRRAIAGSITGTPSGSTRKFITNPALPVAITVSVPSLAPRGT